MDKMAVMAELVLPVSVVLMDVMAAMAKLVLLDYLAALVPLVHVVLMVAMENKAQQVPADEPVLPAHVDLTDVMALTVKPEPQVAMAEMEMTDVPVLPDHQALTDAMALTDEMELTAGPVPLVNAV